MASVRSGKEPDTENYLKNLVSTMFSLTACEEICDLTIQVDDESFPVHRIVLVSASNYFYELITGGSDCVENGVFQLKDVKACTVRQCIEYMYKGEVSVTVDSMFDILQASELFMLDDLVELCLEFMSANISLGNCFRTRMVFEQRGLSTKAQEVDVFIEDKFEKLMSTDAFLNLNRNDLSFFITTFKRDAGLLWLAVKNWVIFDLTERSQHYPRLISSIKNSFGVKFVLDTVWLYPLTVQSKQTKDLMGIVVSEDVTTLKISLTADNCFHASNICEISRHRNSFKAVTLVRHFIAENFDDLCMTKGFLTLSKAAVLEIFRSPKTEAVAEKLKWNVARKWIDHDVGRRKQYFPALFLCIKLENMELEFLRSVVWADNMVHQFRQCKDRIMAATSETPKAHTSIVIVSQTSPSSASAKRPLNAEHTPDELKRAKKIPDSPTACVAETDLAQDLELSEEDSLILEYSQSLERKMS